jgi:predicted house-cleaning noncanonical NTP pyrophosphatase (MazG superfamily)
MKKLVRDKIPEIMIQQGKNPKIETLTDDTEYENALCEKLIEEVHEFIEAKNNAADALLEIVDILEVIDALCILKKYDKNNILEEKLNKKEKRGAFEKRLLLVS